MDVLFVNHAQKNCGVQQFGENTFDIIKNSKKITFRYAICNSFDDLVNSMYGTNNVLFNYYPSTLGWVDKSVLNYLHSNGAKAFTIFHEVPINWFDYYIHPDPTFVETENRFKVGRPVRNYTGTYNKNDRPIVGSFGFGFGNKGWEQIIYKTKESLPDASIRFHIPYAYFGDKDGSSARNIAKKCTNIANSLGIEINVQHDFLETSSLLEFLAGNNINCFFYEEMYGRGIASTLDYALSVRRPIALTKSYMFRHMKDSNIFIEDLSLKEILDNGIRPLKPFYKQFTEENLIKDYERIFERFG